MTTPEPKLNKGTKLANINHAHCVKCDNTNKDYSAKYDAFFCVACDLWLEKACSDPECSSHCYERPFKPSEVK